MFQAGFSPSKNLSRFTKSGSQSSSIANRFFSLFSWSRRPTPSALAVPVWFSIGVEVQAGTVAQDGE